MTHQFGEQNQDGMAGLSAGITDDIVQHSNEAQYAGLREMIDYAGDSAYGHPDVPPDVLIEHAGRFYTALPLDAFKKAGAPRSRSHTYALGGLNVFNPIQILRENPGRRLAEVRITWTVAVPAVSTPVFWSERGADLQALSSVNGAATSPGAISGPWGMGDLLFGPVVFKWYGTGSLWAVSPFADASVHAVYASVTEHFDA